MDVLFGSIAANDFNYPVRDQLFIERDVYEYKLKLEFGLCAIAAGRVAEAIDAFNRVLDAPGVSEHAADTAIRGILYGMKARFGDEAGRDSPKNRIKVVVPFYNAGHFLDNCVESLLAQDYDNFEVLFIDDASSDDCHHAIPDIPKFTLTRNEIRKGGAFNTHRAITDHCQPDDIVVHLDGDDWLACTDALSHINRCYNATECWVLYGQFRYGDGTYGVSRPVPSEKEFGRIRSHWRFSHIRSYRAGVFMRIAEQDPDYGCLQDSAGNWFTSSCDAAVMYPVMELAGFGRVFFNERVLYVYNTDNPLCIHHERREEQLDSFEQISCKPSFARVDSVTPIEFKQKKRQPPWVRSNDVSSDMPDACE